VASGGTSAARRTLDAAAAATKAATAAVSEDVIKRASFAQRRIREHIIAALAYCAAM
jgi:hypothetical protein